MRTRTFAYFGFMAALMAATPAFAEGDEPGDSPAVKLVMNGLAGSGNAKTDKAPEFKIKNAIDTIILGHTSMRDFAAMAGTKAHRFRDGADSVDWVCLESPATGDAPALQVWIFARDVGIGPGKISAVSAEAAPATPPSGCTILDKPFALDLDAPGVGAHLADVTTKFGDARERDPDGTTAYIYGGLRKLPKQMVMSGEFKYAFDGDAVSAAAVDVFAEEE